MNDRDTKKSGKKLKQLVRERMAKTGEKYVEARRRVLLAGGNLCPSCGGRLEIRIVSELANFDDDATDGQIADWFGAIESGDDDGEWAVESEETFCPKCEPPARAIRGALNQIGRRKK